MSIRAYLVKKLETEKEFFNLWHDELFVELLSRLGCIDSLSEDGYGLLGINDIYLKEMKEILEKDEKEEIEKNWDKENIKRAKEIIKEIEEEMEKKKTTYLQFYCL